MGLIQDQDLGLEAEGMNRQLRQDSQTKSFQV